MPDYSIVQQHAAQYVWCNPRQDKQLIFKTARLSPTYGTRHSFTAMREKHTVPTIGSKFHVFKIAYLSEAEINIKLNYQWTRVSTICNTKNMLMDIYLTAGLMLPRTECWIKNTINGALILAIKQDRLIEFNTTDDIRIDVLMTNTPSIKFYTNKFFASAESLSNPRDVYVYGRKIELNSDKTTFSEQYTLYANNVGRVYAYINGWYVSDFTPSKINVGDYVEMVYDSSITLASSVARVNIPTFTSKLTNDDRHFVSPPDFIDNILFYDDIDFYIVGTGALSGRGLYISRDMKGSIRMMTHMGFSISDEIIQSLLNSTLPALSSVGDYRIHYVIRNSGLTRKLTSSRNRLNRFMFLAKNESRAAEFKYENNLPLQEWKYPDIEAADINALYGVRYDHLTPELIKDAYGYHEAAKSLAPSTQPVITSVVDSSRSVDISNVYIYGCTVYEYSSTGLLLEYHTHQGTDSYVPQNVNTTWVEIVTGLASDGTGVGSEDVSVTFNPNFEYRFFRGPPGELEDVTDTYAYLLSENVATWTGTLPGHDTLVLNDQYFFCQEFTTNSDVAVIAYDVGFYVGVGINKQFRTSNVPLAEVDVWLNGHPLAEGIDYHVVWPKVVVTNKTHQLPDKAPNKVLVRGRGHGNVETGYVNTTDSGFIKWGLFSVNDRYNVHWDQSLKAVVNGLAVVPGNIVYTDEENTSVYYPTPGIFEAEATNLTLDRIVSGATVTRLGVSNNHPLNGKPYSLRDSYSGLTVAIPGSTRDYRLDIMDFDKRLSNYLTYKLPEDDPLLPNVISAKYPIISPFIEACMDGMLNETISNTVWDKYSYEVEEVLADMSEHVFLLGGDPTQDAIYDTLDMAIADICAHPYPDKVPVNFNQYRFLEFVAHNILNDRVDISRFFSIGAVD